MEKKKVNKNLLYTWNRDLKTELSLLLDSVISFSVMRLNCACEISVDAENKKWQNWESLIGLNCCWFKIVKHNPLIENREIDKYLTVSICPKKRCEQCFFVMAVSVCVSSEIFTNLNARFFWLRKSRSHCTNIECLLFHRNCHCMLKYI